MRTIIYLAMLLAGITGTSFAQDNTTTTGNDNTFELPPNFAKRKFSFDLGKGNTLQIEVEDIIDLDRFSNLEEILRNFVKDIEPFKDSLSDELSSKRIDYILDASPIKKIRIQQFKPKGSSFTISQGEVSALKLEQDTINFNGTVYFDAKYTLRKAFNTARHYKLSIFINNVNDLPKLIDEGLNEKIANLRKNINTGWKYVSNGKYTRVSDTTVTAKLPRGYVAGGDFLEIRASVDLQNYKSYLIPSFSLGAGLVISSKGYFKREINLSWNPHFLFAKNTQGQLKTFRNDFLVLTLGQGMIKDNEPRKESPFLSIISLGYLIHREGDYFAKNTMRFGAGRLSLFEGKTKIEPVFYFNNFFKGVTPGLRWIQSF